MGSAATANPFQLLIDDENEDPMLMAAAVPQKAPKASPAVAAAPTKPDKSNVPANSVSTDARGEFGRGRGRDSRGGRGGRDGARGGARSDRPDRFDRAPRVQESNEDGFETAGSAGNREGGRGGARLGGRGGRGGRGRGELGASGGSDRPARREYERRDGTGRGHEVVKRGGAGRGNWGTEGEGAEGTEAPVDAEIVEGGSPGDSDAPVQQETVPEEPEEKTMTLEEYEKISAEKRAGLNKTASNQNAVDLQVQFKGMATMSKSNIEEDAAFDLSRAKGTGVRKEKEKKVKDVVTDVGFSVEKVEERSGGFRGGRGRGGDRGDRGDRGEGRGGRGRGGEGRGARGGRGGEGREPAPSLNVEDTSAFPTL